jgi:hypothetical protein
MALDGSDLRRITVATGGETRDPDCYDKQKVVEALEKAAEKLREKVIV